MPYSIRTILFYTFRSVFSTLLAIGTTGVVWGQVPSPTPLPDAALFNWYIRTAPNGNYVVTGDIHLETAHSPWPPFPSFSGVLNGQGHAIHGLTIRETRRDVSSGLFRNQTGTIRDLVFIEPDIVVSGDGVSQGLVAGENSGNITGIVWLGGKMDSTGGHIGIPGSNDLKRHFQGVVGKNYRTGWVEVMARDVTQITLEGFATTGVGAGFNSGGMVQTVALNVTQTSLGSEAFTGIGVGRQVNGTTQVVAQDVAQTSRGESAWTGTGVGSGVGGTVQVVAQDVIQASSGNNADTGIGTGRQAGGTTQVVAQDVIQTSSGNNADTGVGIGVNSEGTIQVVAQDVTQTSSGQGSETNIGVGRGAAGQVVVNQAQNSTRTRAILTSKTEDWNHGNNTQYPMLVDLNGGYQDMQRLSPEFRLVMRNYTPPSNNPNASWFSPEIWEVLESLVDTTEPDLPESTIQPPVTTGSLSRNCPEPEGNPVFQAYDNNNQRLYVVAREPALSTDLMLVRYRYTGLDEEFGKCGKVVYQPSTDLMEYDITSGIFQPNAGAAHIYLTARDNGQIYLFDLLVTDSDTTFNVHSSSRDGQINDMVASGGRLYLTGQDASRVLTGYYQGGPSPFMLAADELDNHDEGQALTLSSDSTYAYVVVTSTEESRATSLFLRKYHQLSLTRNNAFGENGEQLVTDLINGQQARPAVLLLNGWVYAASIIRVDNEPQLLVRRFNPADGSADNHFQISEGDPAFHSGARLALFASGDILHVLTYDRSYVFGASYDTRGNGEVPVSEPFTRSLSAESVASHGIAMTDSNVYLAFKDGSNELFILPVDIPDLVLLSATAGTPEQSEDDPDNAAALGLGIAFGLTVTAAVAVAVAVMGWYLAKHHGSECRQLLSGFTSRLPVRQ